jgi:tetratricopeptide (TPR) repeat protein
MVRRTSPHAVALIVFIAFLGIGSPTAKAQHGGDLETLNEQVVRLYQAGKYAEATGIAKRALTVAELQFGPDDAKVGTALNNLAELYRAEGRYAEAEPLYNRALATDEKALGPTTRTSGETSTPSPSCISLKAATPRPSR